MKHKIISKPQLDAHNLLVVVELLPETEKETRAIQKVELLEASDEERELVNNYLYFKLELGNYSVVKFMGQNKTVFVIDVFIR